VGQQTVPSRVAALVVGTIPLWLALIDRGRLRPAALGGGDRRARPGIRRPRRARRPRRRPRAGRSDARDPRRRISWAAGSLYSREASLPADPVLTASLSALSGGALLACAGAVGGELDDVRPHSISAESLLGVAYLVAFGSIVAYTVYLWLLRAARTSLVATYAFVNPVVALLLGWALLGERIGTRTAVASAAIVAAVALTVAAPAASPAAGKERRRFRGIRERPEPGVPSGEPG
jgi:EamA-like transporter family